jgi:putrescine transport system ATP-binding protein
MLELRDVAAGYGGAPAVGGIDLSVQEGELFCLLGGSGSGKTTLLRCIGGFLTPREGSVWLDGRDVTGLPPHQRDLTTLFQSYALFPHLNVADNVAFGLRRRKARGVDQRVAEMLALVRLEGMGSRRVAQLSGGQQQRVALARCLAPRPRLLLLDEPLSALDPELRAATRADLVTTLRSQGTTSVLVTHDRAEALAVADRIGLLHQGRLVQVGTPRDLFERPANCFVAGFLGDVALLPGMVRESGAATLVELAQGSVVAPGSAHAPGTRLMVALRPERIRVEAGEGPNRLRGVVDEIVYAGATLEVGVVLADGVRLRLVRPAEMHPVAVGDAVTVAWDVDAAMLLMS